MTKNFLQHRLESETTAGLSIKKVSFDDVFDTDKLGAQPHRSDHYIFFLVIDGTIKITVDFNNVDLMPGNLYCIIPSQIRREDTIVLANAWVMAIEASLMPQECINVLEHRLLNRQPCVPDQVKFHLLQTTLELIQQNFKIDNHLMERGAITGLIHTFLYTVAGIYGFDLPRPDGMSRSADISKRFAMLLSEYYKSKKSPSEFAALLYISESYLNEALKRTTGQNVSYWIQQEVILEAKRLLYFSSMSIKEIAYTLGYEDHSYFSRIFKKAAGISANAFRAEYRK